MNILWIYLRSSIKYLRYTILLNYFIDQESILLRKTKKVFYQDNFCGGENGTNRKINGISVEQLELK